MTEHMPHAAINAIAQTVVRYEPEAALTAKPEPESAHQRPARSFTPRRRSRPAIFGGRRWDTPGSDSHVASRIVTWGAWQTVDMAEKG